MYDMLNLIPNIHTITQSLYKEAVESATEALKDNPDNVKAIQRRATANEKLGTWTSLTSALDDYNYLSKSSNTPKASLPAIRQAQRSLPQRIEERKGEETKEMMDKLKGLGNSFLGERAYFLCSQSCTTRR
jgi:hypothetical protein